ncbi:MAG TPA: TorF family putative porin [Opitutaceae bacterium]|nr:TorF family putative porin [Opitutaceae bacterium]
MEVRPATLLLIALLAGGRLSAQSDNPVAAGAFTFTATTVSEYLFRGLRWGGPAVQPGLEYDRGNLALGVWSSLPLANDVPGQSNPEIDPYGWYKVVVSDHLNVQPGFTCYTFPNARSQHGFRRATFEPNVALNYTVSAVTFTPRIYYDTVLRGPTYEVSAVTAVPLGAIGTELDLTVMAGTYVWHDAAAGGVQRTRAAGDYWTVGATIPYQITRTSRVSVGFSYAKGTGGYPRRADLSDLPVAASRGIVTVGYTVTF